MKHSKLTSYLVLSIFFHIGTLIIFYLYPLPTKEKPEDLLPVEVMVIRDLPLVSIQSPVQASEPQIFYPQPAPMATEAKQIENLPDPDPLQAQYAPSQEITLTTSQRMPTQSPGAEITANHLITRITTVKSTVMSIAPLPAEQAPELELEKFKGSIPVATGKKRTTVPKSLKVATPLQPQRPIGGAFVQPQTLFKPDVSSSELTGTRLSVSPQAPPVIPTAKAEMRPYTRPIARIDLETRPGLPVPPGPLLLSPASEPLALKLDRRPTIPFPGTFQGAAFFLVIDTSGSVKGDPLKGIKTSAVDFISLMGRNDRAALMIFNDTTELISDFTPNNESIKSKIRRLTTAGKLTVLYDSLLKASQMIKREDREDLHVVLFSDGKDEGSQADLQQVIGALRSSKISVLAVGYTRVKKEYLNILRNIADETGGVFVQTPEFRDILTLFRSASKAGKEPFKPRKTAEGILSIKSDPAGVHIFINGKYQGQTPKLVALPMGKHDVLMRNDGYYDWQAQVELKEPEEIPLSVDLLPISIER